MNSALIKICGGEYTSNETIENTIKYIYRLNDKKNLPTYGYGIFPLIYENIIKEFEYVRTLQNDVPNRKVWHLVLSFPEGEISQQYLYFSLADKIAKMFGNEYMICYSFHNDTEHFHVHFIISATSYLFNHIDLNKTVLYNYLFHSQTIANEIGIRLEITEDENV